MISEKLLHFIWQHQYFNRVMLRTTDGDLLQIQAPGKLNHDQGPDFLNARILIGDTTWIGNVEVHIYASDWDQHKHSADHHYNNIILHVVWDLDKKISAGKKFPTLELKTLVPKVLLQRYKLLQAREQFVPCEEMLPALSKLSWTSWKERLCVERLQLISMRIIDDLHNTADHWEEVFWWRLARNCGVKLNADLFEQMARTISVNILAKHKNQLTQIEAMLFGQSNLLPAEPADDHTALLIREYEHLKRLHKLRPVKLQPVFLRMRPASFPTLRIAQLATLIFHSQHLFAHILEATTLKQVKKKLQVTASSYWDHHYVFTEVSAFQPKKLGFEMMNNILINTIVPMVFSYGMHHNEQHQKDKAIQWLLELTAEQNQYTRKWVLYSVENENAFDSQALLHLKTAYCNGRRCLECAVGAQLMAAAAEPAQVK